MSQWTRKLRLRRNKATVNHYKQFCVCNDCGRRWPLTFHHVEGRKLFNIGDGGGHTLAALMDEMAKCVILCQMCHDKVHRGYGAKRYA